MSPDLLLPVMKALAIALAISPAAFPLLRRAHRPIRRAAYVVYAAALLTALALTALWYLGIRPPA